MERLAFTIYLFVLLWSPLAFGAVHTQGFSVMTLGLLAGGLLLIAKNITRDRRSGTYRFQLPSTSLSLLFLLLLFFLFFQLIPMPAPVVKLLSPEAWGVGQKAIPASKAVTNEITGSGLLCISPYVDPVRMALIQWITYGLFFFGLSQMLHSRRRIEIAVFAILILGCFESLYGLIQTYSGFEHIWWYKKQAYRGDVTGTYVNRNHFAGLMELTMMLAAVYAGALSLKKNRREAPQTRKSYLRARLSQILSGEQRFNKRAFVLFAGVVMGIGLIFSASRGGMIAAAGGLLAMSLFFIFRKGHRIKGLIVLILFVLISVYALSIGVEYPVGRFAYFDASYKERTRYAQKTLELFSDYPLTGVGVGNFQHAYPKYQAPEDRKAGIEYAHNDWGQFLAEAGIIGFCLFLAGIAYYLYRTIKIWKGRHDPFAVCLGIAPFAALTAIGIHSWSDFNLHIPANFLMLTAILAIGTSALHLESHHHREKAFLPYYSIPLKYKGILMVTVVSGLIVWGGLWTLGHSVAEAHRGSASDASLQRDPKATLETMEKATEWDQGNASAWYDLATTLRMVRDAALVNPDWTDQDRKGLQMRIIRAHEEAARLNPLREEYHLRLAWEYTRLWREPDTHERWIPASDLSMERAAFFAGSSNPYLHIWMGDYWLMRSKTVSPASTLWEITLAKARWHYQKNLSLETGRDRQRMMEHIRRNVWVHYPDEMFVKRLTE